tara:strand:+ start:380 stop:739 length:360 start_codon:yes stop_codon:yes gene_type:complete
MKKIIALFISLMIFSSCATIITGGASKVAMNTPKNSGTTVSVNGIEKGVTPIQLKVKAGDMITFEKDGFDTKTVIVDSKFNTIAILNLFSIIGWGIDAITGSLSVPDSKMINVTLKETK